MGRKKIEVELYSYGIYEPWDRTSKEIPKLKEVTLKIPVQPDVEFGYVIKLKKAKGSLLSFIMHHPPFRDSRGEPAAPFEGEVHVNQNEWSFFLGDTVWEPYEDKAGIWELITFLDGKEIARKSFTLYLPPLENQQEK